jgi:hypothetical protein
VIIYYLDKDLINRSYLIDIRRINEAYTGENIAKAVMLILIKIEILLKLGYFIADNDGRRLAKTLTSTRYRLGTSE